MNILFITPIINRNERLILFERLLKSLNYNKIYYIDTPDVKTLDIEKNHSNVNFINLEKVFFECPEKDIPPVDISIKKTYANIETEYFYMMQRLWQNNLDLIKKSLNFRIKKDFLYNKFYQKEQEFYEKNLIFNKQLAFWDNFLESKKINIIIYFDAAPHSGYDFILYQIAKQKNIPYILDMYSYPGNFKFFVTDYKENIKEFVVSYKEFNYKTEFVKEEFKIEWDRLTSDSETQRMPANMYKEDKVLHKADYKKKIIENFKNFFNIEWWFYYFNLRGNRKFKKLFNEFYLKNVFKPKYKEELYIYVPLHIQPESTTSPLGGIYVDQLLMIKQLSFYLPEGYYLYIKENPKQEFNSYRNINFYIEILKLNNTRLISIKENTFKLIENSIAVATVTGTAGFEGLFKNKPFLMFGYNIFQYAPGVFPIRKNDDLKKVLNDIINKKIKIRLEELKKFMLFLEKNSTRFDIENDLKEFEKGLIKKINQLKI